LASLKIVGPAIVFSVGRLMMKYKSTDSTRSRKQSFIGLNSIQSLYSLMMKYKSTDSIMIT
jgi:hypothetical protein